MSPSEPIQAVPIVDDLDDDPPLNPASPNNHHHDEAIRQQDEAKLEATTLLFLKSE
jgi:hypothetical protein